MKKQRVLFWMILCLTMVIAGLPGCGTAGNRMGTFLGKMK